MFSVKACRICLAMDTELYRMDQYASNSLYQAYTGLTGLVSWCHVHYVCVECAHRLLLAQRLRDKCLRANKLLVDILNSHGEVTEASLRSVDRSSHILQTSLGRCTLESVNISQDGYTVPKDISSVMKSERDSTVVEDDKVWVQIIDSVKEEPEDWPADERSPTIDKKSRLADGRPSRENRARRKVKKPKKIIKDKDVKPLPPELADSCRRRKTQKELQHFYSQFVTIARMTQEEAAQEMIRRRESSSFLAATYRCLPCGRGFHRATAHEHHMSKHDPSSGRLECDYCHLRFSGRHSLLDHFRHRHSLRFSCNRCPYTCTNRNLARQHEAWHNGTLYTCKHCNANFSEYSARQSHLRLTHRLDVPCAECGRCFVGSRGVRAHTLRAHPLTVASEAPSDAGVWCETCAVMFVCEAAHDRHLRVSAKHCPSEQAVTCNVCEEIFANAQEMQLHRKEQHAGRTSSARQEGKRRRNRDASPTYGADTTRGARLKRPRPDMMCETCGKVFHTNWDFETHRRKHTGERPFKCKWCNKSFALKGVLKVHSRTHTQEKPHVCGTCGKAFAERSNMLRHTQVHSESKPVTCGMCDKEFKNQSSLKVHVKYVHLKRPYPLRRHRKIESTLQPQHAKPQHV